ncbi:hypothetical protein CYMTET_40092 [Cymbomonas tetramitiformis]|uniref:Uncharacterized protein n=1 Tax=Cymbomonas tetramitiformis TaxID=36881 RepID=A0AAE0C8U9_9CHLO|nr:hypothetical protein CYMTET_40092 [Cymbomonas tetramitiformis]
MSGASAAVPPPGSHDQPARPIGGSASPAMTNRDEAGLLSRLFWIWLNPLINAGNDHTLTEADFPPLGELDSVESVTADLARGWAKELARVKASRVGEREEFSFFRVLTNTFGYEYAMAGLWKPVWLIVVLIQIYVLKTIIIQLEKDNPDLWLMAVLVTTLGAAVIVQSVSQHQLFILCQRIGVRVKSAVSGLVLCKVLQLQAHQLATSNSGQLVNLITNDTEKMVLACTYFHFSWHGVVEMLAVSAAACVEIGPSALGGLAVVLFMNPIAMFVAKKVGSIRQACIVHTDERVRTTGEVLNAIRVIKYNGWVTAFMDRLNQLRRNEEQGLKKAAWFKASNNCLKDTATGLAVTATFSIFVATGGTLQPEVAFPVIGLFNVLMRVMAIGPMGLQASSEAMTGVRRIEKFLLIPVKGSKEQALEGPFDITLHSLSRAKFEVEPGAETPAVVLKGLFTWPQPAAAGAPDPSKAPSQEKQAPAPVQASPAEPATKEAGLQLQADLTMMPGELLGITGPVGCGKSSFLMALLGEMGSGPFERYEVHGGQAGFVPQQPWIMNDTLRNNILFGLAFDSEWYQQVLDACDLQRDLQDMTGGDLTEIGERGLTLSGGQQARVSLARAVYSRASVLLLDDPLAAVDAPTGRRLMERCIGDSGLLKGTTRLLVTHHLHWLPRCHRVLILKHGAAEFLGPPSDYPPIHSLESEADLEEEQEAKEEETQHEGAKKEEALSTESVQVELGKTPAPQPSTKLVVEEKSTVGSLSSHTLFMYFKACGGVLTCTVVAFTYVAVQVVNMAGSVWIALWTDNRLDRPQGHYAVGYALLIALLALCVYGRVTLFTYRCIQGSSTLHQWMTRRILRAPVAFFDANPAGRVLNRFSKDQGLVDEQLPLAAGFMFDLLMIVVALMCLICAIIPYFLIAIPILLLIFRHWNRRYVAVSRELKRIDGVTRSPIYSIFSTTLQGVTSVRAYQSETRLRKSFNDAVNRNNNATLLYLNAGRWLGVRLDFIAAVAIVVAAGLVFLLRDVLPPGLAGVVLVYSLQMTGLFQYGVRQAAEVETLLTSVERMVEYTEVDVEASLNTPDGLVPQNWPQHGAIDFKDVVMAYRPDLPPVLTGLTFSVLAKEKMGILGRTGSGKSSLVSMLFRLVENSACSGSILVDNVDIARVGLDHLRSRLSIIPQDPTIFAGTIRHNLDPFGLFSSSDIMDVLERTRLKERVPSLDSEVADSGDNFSVGERQLLCLARALLRHTRVLVMDEATASVDSATDALIQRTISHAFADCTVLSIAHRIGTVLHCDRVLLLSAGTVGELDSPAALMETEGSLFRHMVEQAGVGFQKQVKVKLSASRENLAASEKEE